MNSFDADVSHECIYHVYTVYYMENFEDINIYVMMHYQVREYYNYLNTKRVKQGVWVLEYWRESKDLRIVVSISFMTKAMFRSRTGYIILRSKE